jgi:DNA (cytosine-5)-methyltransferase 1
MAKIDNFTFVDLFAGIGGFRIGLERNGGKCVAYSEIDKNAIAVYKDNFDISSETEIGDITKFNGKIECDIVVGGVPCQPWSTAGLKRGFDDERGRLWIDTIKFIEINLPKAFIFENVKGLSDPRNKESLGYIITSLTNLGYEVHSKLVNAFEYGIPQNRERIFIVGILKKYKVRDFNFPKKSEQVKNLNNYLKLGEPGKRVIKLPLKSRGHHLAGDSNKGNFFTLSDIRDGDNCIHSWDLMKTTKRQKSICITILKNRRKKIHGAKDGNPLSFKQLKYIIEDLEKSELDKLVALGILKKVGGKYEFVNSKNSSGINGVYRLYLPTSIVYPTITKTGSKDFLITKIPKNITKETIIAEVIKKKNYRALTVKEAGSLQSFPSKMKFRVEDEIAFGLLGNAVPVLVVEKIMYELYKSIK